MDAVFVQFCRSHQVVCHRTTRRLGRLLGLDGGGGRRTVEYAKLDGIDTFGLVRQLQSHGIRVLGSTIIGLEEHTPENIDQVIEHAVRHDTDFHQFMLYTPLPGTPLHAEFSAQGRMLDEVECPLADTHGQFRFNYRHPHIPAGLESELIVRAFQRDFAVNGPSMLRVLRTTLAGWKRYKNHPDPRIRRRFAWEVQGMATTVFRRRRGREAVLPKESGPVCQDVGTPGRNAPRVWLDFTALCSDRRSLCLAEDPPGGKATGPRLDL